MINLKKKSFLGRQWEQEFSEAQPSNNSTLASGSQTSLFPFTFSLPGCTAAGKALDLRGSSLHIIYYSNEPERGGEGRGTLSSYYGLHWRVDTHKLIIALCFIQQNNFHVVA